MLKADAILEDASGRPTLRFDRALPQPPERVWEALTNVEELKSWHPTPFEFEPRIGGRVSYVKGGKWPEFADGEVTEYEPPRLLAYTWDTDALRWEVLPHGDGCRLILTHSFDDRLKAARDGAGWTVCLQALGNSLADAPGGGVFDDDPNGTPPGWSELNATYQERFGISPEEATPPPSSR